MAEFSQSKGSDIIYDFYCELCIDKNKQVEAEGFCVDCGEYLCGSCYSGHRKSRLTRHHILQDQRNMPKDTPLPVNRISKDISTKCQRHSGELLKYYCRTCAVLGCSACFVEGHRGCSGIESIVDVSVNIIENEEFKNFLGQIQLIQKKTNDIRDCARRNKSVSQKCCTDVVSSVRRLKEKAVVKLNEAEQNIVELAEQMKSEDEVKMKYVEMDCDDLSGKLQQISSDVDRLLISKRVCQIYIAMRELQGEVEALQKSQNRIRDDNVVRTFRFESNPDLASAHSGPSVFGKITHQLQQASPTAVIDPGRCKMNVSLSRVGVIKVTSGDEMCYISGAAVVSEDRLLLVDMSMSNHKAKLVDTNTETLLSELELSSKTSNCSDVTVINRHQAAVTLPDMKRILLLRIDDTLTQQREIAVSGKCRGVAYNRNRLIVTFVDNPRVEIIDLYGNVIRSIENARDGSKLFKSPLYVRESRDGEIIYVSDSKRNTVTSLTFDGEVKSIYKDAELKEPQTLCTDSHGNVFICGWGSSNIHMITADCRKIKVIIEDLYGHDCSARSITFCRDTNRLYIGMWFANEVFIEQLTY